MTKSRVTQVHALLTGDGAPALDRVAPAAVYSTASRALLDRLIDCNETAQTT